MILYFRITKERKKALLLMHPNLRNWLEETVSKIADRIIASQFDIDRELKEYHDRRVLNNYNIKSRKQTEETKRKIKLAHKRRAEVNKN